MCCYRRRMRVDGHQSSTAGEATRRKDANVAARRVMSIHLVAKSRVSSMTFGSSIVAFARVFRKFLAILLYISSIRHSLLARNDPATTLAMAGEC